MPLTGDSTQAAAASFVDKWSRAALTERAASHEHFLDLCRLLDLPSPATADATGEDYCFEKYVKVVRSASKGSKGDGGYVDVWKRGCFAWEYKQKDKYKYKDLDEAYRQLYQYRDALDNPPLSVVCDIRTTEIRTHFSGYPTTKIVIKLEEIPGKLEFFRRLFTDPDSFKRTLRTTETVTNELAGQFGDLATALIARYPVDDLSLWESAGSPVAHFLMKVMFCLFAEDVNLLPDQAFTKLINISLFNPEEFDKEATRLFELMRTGGRFGFDTIPCFNGGLFDDKPALPLKAGDLQILRRIAGDNENWAGVEPSIFGTLFERILDPRKRAQIGAHYTSKADILLVVEPVVMTPLRRKWQEIQANLGDTLAKHDGETNRKKREPLAAPITIAVEGFRRHLAAQRVLDPACGSGNFLYVALQQLLDLEDEAVRFCAARDIPVSPIPYVRPTQLHGIEINPYAAELAQVVIWIGYLQWLHVHGIENPKRPILDKLQTIENRDAILDLTDKKNPAPAKWPEADFIIGNPPFLGFASFLTEGLSADYVSAMRKAVDVPQKSDLCCYWFELGRRSVAAHPPTRVGLLATQAIRSVFNREVLRRIGETGHIFWAWSNRPWVLEGAKLRVAMIGFGGNSEATTAELDGETVDTINDDLSTGVDAANAGTLQSNLKLAFEGDQMGGSFDIDLTQARSMLSTPNASGKSNALVVVPRANASDIAGRWDGAWVVDFGARATLEEVAAFEAPLHYVEEKVKPERLVKGEPRLRKLWWMHKRPRPELRAATSAMSRVLVTPRVAKHRMFSWLAAGTVADSRLFVFARSDDYFLGVLQSAVHELWSLRVGARHGDGGDEAEGGRPTYNGTLCFETFPLPWPPGKEDAKHPAYARVAAAAKALDEQRERWLNPPEWVEPLAAKIDAADDFSDVPADARPLVRRSAILAAAAQDPRLKKRTLTNLYNERPTWLKLAHLQLDKATLSAYAATDPAGQWDEAW